MIDFAEVFAILDDQDPRLHPIAEDQHTKTILTRRKYLVDNLLRCISREEPFNRLRLKALAVHAALNEWGRKKNGEQYQ